jgi:tetratricopeptide (TPR) repeat protein
LWGRLTIVGTLVTALATSLGLFNDAMSVWKDYGPTPPVVLTGDVSVAVYGLGIDTGGGTLPTAVVERIDELETGLPQHLAARISALESEGLDVDTAGPEQSDLPDPDPGKRAQAMRERADRVHADYVLSGTVSTATGSTSVRPELYVSEGAVPGAGELTGFHQLGTLDLYGDLNNPVVVADLRARLLDSLDPVVELAIGLAYDARGDRDDAKRHVMLAEQGWNMALDPQLLHLTAGNLAGRRGDLVEAERRYRLADREEGSGRARFGLAEVVYQRAGCGTRSVEAVALREAEQRYRGAGAADHPPEAHLEERIAFGLGRVQVCLGQAGIEQRWADAERELSRVTAAFEAGESELRELASEAHALRAIVALPAPDDPAPEQRLEHAETHARRAVELAVDSTRRGVHSGQLGFVLGELGQREEARAAYEQAAELDAARADEYRQRVTELNDPGD